MPCSRRRSRCARSTRTASSTRRRASRSPASSRSRRRRSCSAASRPIRGAPRKTEAAMAGKTLTLDDAGALAKILAREVGDELDRWAERMAEAPDEGFTSGVPHAARRVVPLQGDRQRAGARGRRGAAGREVERRDHLGPLAGQRRHAALRAAGVQGARRAALHQDHRDVSDVGPAPLHARARDAAAHGERRVRAEPARARQLPLRDPGQRPGRRRRRRCAST